MTPESACQPTPAAPTCRAIAVATAEALAKVGLPSVVPIVALAKLGALAKEGEGGLSAAEPRGSDENSPSPASGRSEAKTDGGGQG
jgi:hypothetical protein